MNGGLIKQGVTASTEYLGIFLAQVFGWMTVGLFITGVVGFAVMSFMNYSPDVSSILLVALPIVFILELIIVIALSAFWRKLNAVLAIVLFLAYAAFNGLFIGILMYGYELQSLAVAFGVTAGIFLLLAGYGFITKADLTRWGTLAIFGLIGLIFGTIVNIIIAFINPSLSNGLYWILTYVGIIIFLILIAFDAQKLKMIAAEAESTGGSMLAYSIRGALTFYLDFINLFIRILAVTGKRRR